MMKKISFIIPILSLMIYSCDKHHAKKLSGTYYCNVQVNGAYGGGDSTNTTFIDTNYYEDIEVEQDGKNLIVLYRTIPIDSVWKEKEYQTNNGLKILFRNDSIYINSSQFHSSGHSEWFYKGIKK